MDEFLNQYELPKLAWENHFKRSVTSSEIEPINNSKIKNKIPNLNHLDLAILGAKC